MIDRFDPMGDTAQLVERNRTRPAEEISDAVIARAHERIEREWAQYTCPENPIYHGYDEMAAAEYGAPAGIYELDTRADDRRVVLKIVLALVAIGGIVAWAWWRG